MNTDMSKAYLKNINAFHVYPMYIQNHLAGDFACAVACKIESQQKEIEELKARVEGLIETSRDNDDNWSKLYYGIKKLYIDDLNNLVVSPARDSRIKQITKDEIS